MKKTILAVILMLFFINVHANEWTVNLNFFVGQKMLDEDDWAPFDRQREFGMLLDFKQSHWPVSIAIDLLSSDDQETESIWTAYGETTEFDVGVRKIWKVAGSSIRPYIGGGLAYINAEIRRQDIIFFVPTVSDDDSGTGIWLNGGVYWSLSQYFNLGFDLRYSQADVTFFGTDGEAGGTHAGVTLGYHW